MSYDSVGRIDYIDYPTIGTGTAVRAQYGYDQQSGALTTVTEAGGAGPARPIWEMTNAFQGYLTQDVTFGNGSTSSFGYDADHHRLSSAYTELDDTAIQDLQYSYYNNGQVRERITPDRNREYFYDELGRLSRVETPNAATKQYHYDEIGNITTRGFKNNVYRTDKPHLLDYVSHLSTTSYSYDGSGNVQSRVGPAVPGGSQTIDYTHFDLPKTITTGSGSAARDTEFDYSAEESRVVRREFEGTGVGRTPQGARHFVSKLYERLIDATGDTLEERFRIMGDSGVVAEIIREPGSERTLYYHGDHLGTPDTISDNDGNNFHQEYDPFGELLDDVPAINEDLTRIGFTGHQQDNDLGFIDMGGRIYDPLAARFASADPVMQAPFWSQGLNRYSYVFNDPINFTDPSGFSAESKSEVAGGMAPLIIGGSITLGTMSFAVAGVGGSGTGLWLNSFFGGNPFSGSSAGPSRAAAAPTRAPGSMPSQAGAKAQNGELNPLGQERPAESYAAGPKNVVPCAKNPDGSCKDVDIGLEPTSFVVGTVIRKGPTAARLLINLLKNFSPRALKWTAHGGKHIVSARVAWADVIKSTLRGPAKYRPGINVEELERRVWQQGLRVTNGKSWKVMDVGQDIGASAGSPSNWVRVELSGDTLHGHPITFDEFTRLLTP
jgi:RHS repeat-associated protein